MGSLFGLLVFFVIFIALVVFIKLKTNAKAVIPSNVLKTDEVVLGSVDVTHYGLFQIECYGRIRITVTDSRIVFARNRWFSDPKIWYHNIEDIRCLNGKVNLKVIDESINSFYPSAYKKLASASDYNMFFKIVTMYFTDGDETFKVQLGQDEEIFYKCISAVNNKLLATRVRNDLPKVSVKCPFCGDNIIGTRGYMAKCGSCGSTVNIR